MNRTLDYNYHTHTYRCGHATGTEREYIEEALSKGIRYMGFSEHIPFRFPDGEESFYRMPVALTEDYLSTLRALREEYRGKMDIVIGYEMEYYPLYFDQMLRGAMEAGAEYLILGQHFIRNEQPERLAPYHMDQTNGDYLKEYVDSVEAALRTGYFTYVAHPDYYHFTDGPEDAFQREMGRLCRVALETDTPLEINFNGIRQHRFYPSRRFFKLVGEYGVPVTCGFDAHDVKAAGDTESFAVAEELIDTFHLNYIGRPKIRLIQAMR